MRVLFHPAGLIGLLLAMHFAVLVIPQRISGCPRRTNAEMAEVQVASLSRALLAYKDYVGRFPTALQGLNALIQAPDALQDSRRWKGPYLADCKSLPPDPWGHAFVYAGRVDGKACSVVCYGSDARPGGSGEAEEIVKELTPKP